LSLSLKSRDHGGKANLGAGEGSFAALRIHGHYTLTLPPEITMRRLAILAALAAATALLPSAAWAHPRLVSASPAANAAVAKPTRLTLTFSETLVAPLSGIELTMTGMPGMANHAPMPIRGFTSQVAGKTITVTLPRALPAGSYELKWHAVAADQHRIEDRYSFTVR
jgi:hypothetical protein